MEINEFYCFQIGETDSHGFKYSVNGTEAGAGSWVLNKDYLRLLTIIYVIQLNFK